MVSHYIWKSWPVDKGLKDIDLTCMSVWVPIFGLAPDQMIESNALILFGQRIGRVVEIDRQSYTREGARKSYTRVRIDMDCSKALEKGARV